jgi:hypothetical protein
MNILGSAVDGRPSKRLLAIPFARVRHYQTASSTPDVLQCFSADAFARDIVLRSVLRKASKTPSRHFLNPTSEAGNTQFTGLRALINNEPIARQPSAARLDSS